MNAELSQAEREAAMAALRPPRRSLTDREVAMFETARAAIFEQGTAHEEDGLVLPPFDEDRIYFRAGLLAAEQREQALSGALAAAIDLLDCDSFDRARIDPLREPLQ
jgi:hypothetical protein